MITYSNIQRFNALPFLDYLRLPAYSHSFLKMERGGVAEDLALSENIRIGKLVDSILTGHYPGEGPGLMADSLYPVAKDISYFIQKQFGQFIKHFIPQVSYTAEVEYNGFHMPAKGRLDWLLHNQAVVDLKVTRSRDVRSVIDFMGYRNQVFHYAKLAQVTKGYLMVHSIPLRTTELLKVDCSGNSNIFWQEKILSFGKVREVVS